MQDSAPTTSGLDMVQVLRDALRCFWEDFAAIILSGMVLILIPGLINYLLAPDITLEGATPSGWGTLMQTVAGLGGMIFAALVSFGTLVRLGGRPLSPGLYVYAGLRAMQPGLLVALLMGVLIMSAGVIQLTLAGSAIGRLTSGVVMGALILLIVIWVAALPAAIAERLGPFNALKRSQHLTRGQRWRVFAVLLMASLALLPALMLITIILFGANAGPQGVLAKVSQWTLFSPGLWVLEITNLLIAGLLAPLPAALYHHLRHLQKN